MMFLVSDSQYFHPTAGISIKENVDSIKLMNILLYRLYTMLAMKSKNQTKNMDISENQQNNYKNKIVYLYLNLC